MYPIEKNWMRFETADGSEHYIRSLQPFIVLRTGPGMSRPPELVVRDEIALFRDLVKKRGLAVHGGSNPVLVRGRSPALAPNGWRGGFFTYTSR